MGEVNPISKKENQKRKLADISFNLANLYICLNYF